MSVMAGLRYGHPKCFAWRDGPHYVQAIVNLRDMEECIFHS